MSLLVNLCSRPNRLCFKDIPNVQIPYQKRAPAKEPFFRFSVRDAWTQQEFTAFVKDIALKKIGLSTDLFAYARDNPQELTSAFSRLGRAHFLLQQAKPVASEHLSPQYRQMFQDNILEAAQVLQDGCDQCERMTFRCEKTDTIPEMYVMRPDHLFASLKKSRLGRGAYGKVKRALWLTAGDKEQILVAKKVVRKVDLRKAKRPVTRRLSKETLFHHQRARVALRNEGKILEELRGKRGIVPIVAAADFDAKPVLFLSLYQCSLQTHEKENFPLFVSDQPEIISQTLDGLRSVAEKGEHRDIAERNILVRRDLQGKIEAVISDFGNFRRHDSQQSVVSEHTALPPEYYTQNIFSPKLDVWALGLVLYRMCACKNTPNQFLRPDQMKEWSAGLAPGWILSACPPDPDTPPFIVALLNDMLDPRPEFRPTAQEAHERFEREYAQWQQARSVQSKKRKASPLTQG